MTARENQTNNMNKIEEIKSTNDNKAIDEAWHYLAKRTLELKDNKGSGFAAYHVLRALQHVSNYILSNPSQFNLVSQEGSNPLINAARGRDACGINHDELNLAHQEEIKELKQQADKLAEGLKSVRTTLETFYGANTRGSGIREAYSIIQQTLTEYEKLK